MNILPFSKLRRAIRLVYVKLQESSRHYSKMVRQKSRISMDLKFHFNNQKLSRECRTHKREENLPKKINLVTFSLFFFFFFVILQLMSPEILIKMFESFMELLPQYLLATIMPFPVSLWYLTIFSGIRIYERSRTI